MLFTADEKEEFEKICASCNLTKAQVKQVFLATLHVLTRKTYSGANEITIPFIAKLKYSIKEEMTPEGIVPLIKIDAEPCNAFKREVAFIQSNETTPTEKYFNILFDDYFNGLLEIDS